MKHILLLSLSAVWLSFATAQKNVSGMFVYKATIALPDTNIVLKAWDVVMYTNDTIVRVETETDQVGRQVYIRHMELKKAYLLLSFDGVNYAIQTNLEDNGRRDSLGPQYTITKKWGSRKIAGYKCKKYYVLDNGQQEGYYCWFAKKLGNKYLEVYPEVSGLATDYYIPSQEGLIHYELQSFTPGPVNRDLFGVPSDFKRVTFEEFVNLFSEE